MDQVDKTIGTAFPDRRAVEEFQSALVSWFAREGRDYPWRRTRNPYAILVSELMLQQTQIATVLERGYFDRWMKRFPDLRALANASEEEVLKAWEGLGYYNRARNLQKAARTILDRRDGRFPETVEEMLELPGVGRYTAGAVVSFAFDRRGVIVDGNVTRVLSRVLAHRNPVDTPAAAKLIWSCADRLTPDVGAKAYNSAVMELGQRLCTKAAPACDRCPVRGQCAARERGIAGILPVKKRKSAAIAREERIVIPVRKERVFLCRETGSRRRGLWRLPEITEGVAGGLHELFRFNYAITRYRVNLVAYGAPASRIVALTRNLEGEWFPFGSLDDLPPLGSPYRKALENYRNSNENGGAIR
ncbi:MAG: A/G-specific adenine glycosylase [Verrucomicrobiales bacterium]